MRSFCSQAGQLFHSASGLALIEISDAFPDTGNKETKASISNFFSIFHLIIFSVRILSDHLRFLEWKLQSGDTLVILEAQVLKHFATSKSIQRARQKTGGKEDATKRRCDGCNDKVRCVV